MSRNKNYDAPGWVRSSVLAGCVVLGLSACKSMDRTPLRPLASSTFADSSGVQVSPGPGIARRIQLMHSPRFMREDFSSPRTLTRSRFLWYGRVGEWRIQMAKEQPGSAGFIFGSSHNFHGRQDAYSLTFKMKPAALASRIKVGLRHTREGNREQAHLVECLLSDYQQGITAGNWGFFVIPFSAFQAAGPAAGGDEQHNWASVEGIQFAAVQPNHAMTPMYVRQLEFRDSTFLPQYVLR